jgi:hypothetical protein
MAGETDLQKLLGAMQPELLPGVMVFSQMPLGQAVPDDLDAVMVFREREGTTLILTQEKAWAAGLACSFPCRMITLNIHSSLKAVGFLAVITTRLAAAGMGVNPVSAFHHDHLYVPADRAEEAMEILESIVRENA